jgi:methionyl-tRNA formyltransferase
MKFILFSLTGFGNQILRKLSADNRLPDLIISRKESSKFPHYNEINIEDEARKYNIPVIYQLNKNIKADIIISATYHNKIPNSIIANAKYAVNFHPSLLPNLKGKNPFYFAIKERLKVSGITCHALTDDIDCGPILNQIEIGIDEFETQGTLRKKMAILCSEQVSIFLNDPENYSKESFKKNVNSIICKNSIDTKLNLSKSDADILSQIRSLSPYPGADITPNQIKKIKEFSSRLMIEDKLILINLTNKIIFK